MTRVVEVSEAERREKALKAHSYHYAAAAEELGLNRETLRSWWLRRKIKYGHDKIDIMHMKLREENRSLRAHVRDLESKVMEVDGLVESLASTERLEPVQFGRLPARAGTSRETAILMLSDVQYGESVSLPAMDGLNSYNPEIANRRIERFFQASLDLLTKHWPGESPERVILVLGGDMVSGDIHEELRKTNALAALPAARYLVAHILGGVSLLMGHLKCPIDIISVPGNHGRSTLKYESKDTVETNYDTLVADFLQMGLSGQDQATVYIPSSPDALFGVYGWKFLVTHGDRMGSRGGQGFVGPAAAVARGFKRTIGDYAARGVHVDWILCGHFHVALELEEGFCNASLVGPSEFSRDSRFRPQPASQLLMAVHPQRGITQVRRIQVGSPDEGALYQGPPVPSEVERPRYRVKAVGVKYE